MARTFVPGNIVRLSRMWERSYVKSVGHKPEHSADAERKVLEVDGNYVLSAHPGEGRLWSHADNLVLARKSG